MMNENDKVLGGWLIVRGLNGARLVRADEAEIFLARQWRNGLIEVSVAELDYRSSGIFTLRAKKLLKHSPEVLFGSAPALRAEFPSMGILSLPKGYAIFQQRDTDCLRCEFEDDHTVVYDEDVPVFRVPSGQSGKLRFPRKLTGKGKKAAKGSVIATLKTACDVDFGNGEAVQPPTPIAALDDAILQPQLGHSLSQFRLLAAMPADLNLATKEFELPDLAKCRLLKMLAHGDLAVTAPSKCTVVEVNAHAIVIQEEHSHSKQSLRLGPTAVPLVGPGDVVYGGGALAYFIHPDAVMGETFAELAATLDKHIYSAIEEFLKVTGNVGFVPHAGTKFVDARNLNAAALAKARRLNGRPEVWLDCGSAAVELAPGTAYLHLDSIEWPVKMIEDEFIQITFQVLRDSDYSGKRERVVEPATA